MIRCHHLLVLLLGLACSSSCKSTQSIARPTRDVKKTSALAISPCHFELGAAPIPNDLADRLAECRKYLRANGGAPSRELIEKEEACGSDVHATAHLDELADTTRQAADYRALLNAALRAGAARQAQKAVSELERLREKISNLDRAHLLLLQSRAEESRKISARVLETDSDDPRARGLVLAALIELGQLDAARIVAGDDKALVAKVNLVSGLTSTAFKNLEGRPGIDARVDRGWILVSLHAWELAERTYSSVLQEMPCHDRARLGLAVAKLESGDGVSSAAILADLAAGDGRVAAEADYYLGLIEERFHRDRTAAIDAYERYLERAGRVEKLHPVHARLRFCRAGAKSREGESHDPSD